MRQFLFAGLLLPGLLLNERLEAQTSIGIKLGAGLSIPQVTVTPTTYDDWSPESKFGAVVGLFMQVPLKKNWVFAPAVQLSSKGIKEKHVSTTYNYNFKSTSQLSYVEVPLNFIHSSRAGGNGFQIGGGPVAGFLSKTGYRSFPVKSLDFGINGLVGYQTPIGFSAQLAYTFGIVNVADPVSNVPTFRNRFLSFSVGYLF